MSNTILKFQESPKKKKKLFKRFEFWIFLLLGLYIALGLLNWNKAHAAISGVQINSTELSPTTLTIKWQFNSLPSVDYFGVYTLFPYLNGTSRTDIPGSGDVQALNNDTFGGSYPSYPNVTMRDSSSGCNLGIPPKSAYSTGVEYTDTFSSVYDIGSSSWVSVGDIDTGADVLYVLKYQVGGACNFNGVGSDSYETLSLVPPWNPVVDVYYPVASSTNPSTLRYIGVSYDYDVEESHYPGNLLLTFSTSSSAIADRYSETVIPLDSSSDSRLYPIPSDFSSLPSPSTIFVKAYLWDENYTTIASSTTSFYVSRDVIGYSSFPTSTFPTYETSDLINTMRQRLPFGWGFDVYDLFQNLSVTSSTASTTVSVDLEDSGLSSYNINFFDASVIYELTGFDAIPYIRGFLEILLYATFAFFLWSFVINLHI